jgi:hypothetical protein
METNHAHGTMRIGRRFLKLALFLCGKVAMLSPKPLEVERVKGIEPSSQPWEGHILPLNHTRVCVGYL